MKAKAYAVHKLPGRTRFKVPARRADRPFFDELERRLKRVDGVTDVTTNPTTASVLVLHEGEIADLAKQLFGSEVEELVEVVLGAPPVARRLGTEVSAIDRSLQHFTGGELDLRTLASIGLLVMAAVQLMRGQHPVTAVSLGWYASELLRRSAGGAQGAD